MEDTLDILDHPMQTTNLPSGFDGVEVKGNSKKSNLEFYGLKLRRFHKPGDWTKLIGKRTFKNGEPHRIYELFVKRDGYDGKLGSCVYEDGKILFTIGSHHLNQSAFEYVTVAALHAVLHNRCRRKGTHRKEEENA